MQILLATLASSCNWRLRDAYRRQTRTAPAAFQCHGEAFAVSRGFSLVELMIVCSIVGIVLAAAIPAYMTFSNSNSLGSTASALSSEVHLMRAKAMSAKVTVNLGLTSTPTGLTYQLIGGGLNHNRTIPAGISLAAGSDSTLSILRNGRAAESRRFILTDRRGNRDTVSVQLSGVVIVL